MSLPFYLMVDFDGVLQDATSDPFIPMRYAKNLALITEVDRSIRIVVTSTHREGKSLDHLRSWFPAELRDLVVGMTTVLPEGRAGGGRQREIEAWLVNRPHASWLALDDEAYLYDKDCAQFVHVQSFRCLDVDLAQIIAEEVRATLRESV